MKKPEANEIASYESQVESLLRIGWDSMRIIAHFAHLGVDVTGLVKPIVIRRRLEREQQREARKAAVREFNVEIERVFNNLGRPDCLKDVKLVLRKVR